MTLPMITVTAGTVGFTDGDGAPASGSVTFRPIFPATGGGAIVVPALITAKVAAGQFVDPVELVSNASVPALQYSVTEFIDGCIADRYTITPEGSTLDLSSAPRGGTPVPLYVLASTVGQPNGVASLDADGHVPADQLGSLSSGVAAFNGRTGTVLPASGDYTAAQVGADAAGTAAAAQTAAETFATNAVATETTRAETAEALLAPKASPTFTGTPVAPTATPLASTTQVATTAYADAAVGVERARAQAAESTLTGNVASNTTAVTGLPVAYRNRVGTKGPRWGQPAAIVTHAQTGHGWTAASWGSSNLNDTSDFLHGSQVMTGTTPGNAATFPTFTKTGATVVDLTGKMLRVWVKIDAASDPRNLKLLNLRAAATGGLSGGSYYSWDLQTTNLTGSTNLNLCWLPAGQWVPVTVGPADRFTTGTPTLTAIQEWRLVAQDNGTAVTVHFGGVDVYPQVNAAYPAGVVTICFDDSYVGQYSIARPILAGFGYQASMFPIIDQIGNGASFYTLANLHLLHDELGWEVAPHASTLANHSGFGGLTAGQIESDVAACLAWQQANAFRWAGSYAYPLGYFAGGQDTTVAPMVDAARTIDSTLKTETFPLGQQYRLRSPAGVGGLGGIGVTAYTNAGGILDALHSNGGWGIITLHDVSAGTSTNVNQISQADLTTLVGAINSKGVAVATFGDVLRTALNP